MADDIVYWPPKVLVPASLTLTQNAFSRSGGKTLGGIDRSITTDFGYWTLTLTNVALMSTAARRTWNAIRSALGGKVGLVAVPAWSFDAAPYVSGYAAPTISPHSDGSDFSDGSGYMTAAISVVMASNPAIGETVVTLQIINAAADLTGIRFSYQHALYETGPAISVSGNLWTVPIFPAIRQAIPAGAALNCDMPTCLMHLATDSAMDGPLSPGAVDTASVSFVEAVDYWADLALAA